MQPAQMISLPKLNGFGSMLMEFMNEGLIAVSHHLKPVYLNSKAKEICQRIWNIYYQSDRLPPIISQISSQLINNTELEDKAIVMDYLTDGERTIRIRACSLGHIENYPWIIVFLEDRSAIWAKELLIEQKKYNLTDRETQTLNLLTQAYTYQEIAKTLQISLNTVKFHVKNIYAKRRSSLEKEKKMYFEVNSQ